MQQKIILVFMLVIIVVMSISTTIFADWPKPEVFSLSTNWGRNNETVDLTINGADFAPSVVVELTQEGQPDIVADNIQVISQNELTCTLDLRGKTPGIWDVTVINMNRFMGLTFPKLVIILNGFTIKPDNGSGISTPERNNKNYNRQDVHD